MSYICKESDILYLDKELFTYENKAFSERYTALYRDGHSQATNENVLAADNRTDTTGQADKEKVLKSCSPLPEKTFKGVPYSEIIAEWWRQNGGEPQEGERNVKLYQLAVSLRAICDNNRELLLQIMPRLGLSEEELRSIVESACKETPKGISKMMQAVLQRTVPEPAALDRRSLATNGSQEPHDPSAGSGTVRCNTACIIFEMPLGGSLQADSTMLRSSSSLRPRRGMICSSNSRLLSQIARRLTANW